MIHEKSPYLLQHAFNPVDWFPWGKEAIEKAKKEDKPIFLSIGYSTCHWCHVMARESFQNSEIAAVLNRYFVSIKVDREERPDLDQVYMAATQALTGGGGWPMSIFLTHDLKPFYAGTYFPPEPKYGKPAFPDLLEAIHKAWDLERDKIMQSAKQITAHLQQITVPRPSNTNLTETLLAKAYNLTAVGFDKSYGGFGNAPKFPRSVTFNFLLRYYSRSGEEKSLEMVLTTLSKMAAGGIHDQISGGFHRYSVDGQWRVPHFEKMLYDQAQLAIAYLEAYQITKDTFYAGIAQDVLDYVLRDMTGPHGGFYSAEDADSSLPENPEKHGEGVFYLFTKKEIVEVLGTESGKIFSYYYGVEDQGNALFDPHGEFAGKNILYVANSLEETANHFDKSPTEIKKLLDEARQRLYVIRAERPRPLLDDKVITSWNGLMIGAFARGYQVLNQPRYLKAAERSARVITSKLYDPKQKVLLRRYRDGAAGLEAHLDDYAFFIHGLLDLYEASLDIRWMLYAIDLTQKEIELVWDPKGAGFYDTSGKDKAVLLRMKKDYEGAEPS
ncbi:MAG: thioredoxin domain-containing protein, partial [Syntrophobacteria bacterium]